MALGARPGLNEHPKDEHINLYRATSKGRNPNEMDLEDPYIY